MKRHYHWYKGQLIVRCIANSSGMRWHCFSDKGQLRADTLAGMKELIRGTL